MWDHTMHIGQGSKQKYTSLLILLITKLQTLYHALLQEVQSKNIVALLSLQ